MSLSFLSPQPIGLEEFLRMLRRCNLPNGIPFPSKIAVGNSGGPDSTCLLFLLHRCLLENSRRREPLNLPQSVISLSVDHNLQESSGSMAKCAEDSAKALNIPHITAKIPWGMGVFPPKPSAGEPIELVARNARFRVLFDTMSQQDTPVIAYGHHADDQVETSLMRLAAGSGELGAGAMKRVRRWGMGVGKAGMGLGGSDDINFFGYEGMRKWIIRPLLDVSKDRILATCEANNLEYVTDMTNFQPSLTLRNAIRHKLTLRDSEAEDDTVYPSHILQSLQTMESTIESLQAVSELVDPTGGKDQLRMAVKALSARVEDIEAQVDSIIQRRRLPSAVGTFHLSTQGMENTEPIVRTALILRILRYISFHPWGSTAADGKRRRDGLAQIVSKVFGSEEDTPYRFMAGGGVLWTPVRVGYTASSERKKRMGWIASRSPPPRHSPTSLDVTDRLKIAMEQNNQSSVQVLFDCRYLVTFRLDKIPSYIATSLLQHQGRIEIRFFTQWHQPQVFWVQNGVHGKAIFTPPREIKGNLPVWGAEFGEKLEEGSKVGKGESWIQSTWIRTIGAL